MFLKVFFNKQCKEREGSRRRGKTSDLFKKTGTIKGTFHPKTGTIRDRIGKDLKETEEMARIHIRTVQKRS